eukprot:COSAG02_NODE_12253_length_1573_cov_1.033243_2_plen_57_part_01
MLAGESIPLPKVYLGDCVAVSVGVVFVDGVSVLAGVGRYVVLGCADGVRVGSMGSVV